MRAAILAIVGGPALAASAQAAPLAPKPLNLVTHLPNQEWVPLPKAPFCQTPVDAVPLVDLVAGDWGWGWHRVYWQDHWGYWHWHCILYGHVHHHGRTRIEHLYEAWRGRTGGWVNP